MVYVNIAIEHGENDIMDFPHLKMVLFPSYWLLMALDGSRFELKQRRIVAWSPLDVEAPFCCEKNTMCLYFFIDV